MLRLRQKHQSKPTWDEAGISAFADAGGVVKIEWQDVTGVFAYKKDRLTADQIRLMIKSKDWQIEFTEDDQDFSELRDFIAEKFGITADWHNTLICSPAFDTTWTVVYSAESESPFKEAQ